MIRKTTKETVAVPPVRVAKARTPRTVSVGEVAVHRDKTAAHSKTVEASVAANPHDHIARIAYGYWEARGFEPGSAEEDWLRAEREYLLQPNQ